MTFKVFMTEFMLTMILRDLESLLFCSHVKSNSRILEYSLSLVPMAKKNVPSRVRNRCQGLQTLTGLNKILQLVTGCFPDMF